MKNSKFVTVFLMPISLLLFLFSTLAFADVNAPELFTKIHMANEVEIKAGNLALEKAQNAEVKKYAEHLIRDHEQTDKLVLSLVDARDIALLNLPVPAEDVQMLANLEAASTLGFDQIYLDEMIKAHTRVIAELETYSALLDASQLDLLLLVNMILPTLRRHLEEAQELRNQL